MRLSSVQLTQVFNQIISLLRKVTHGEKNDQASFHQASKMVKRLKFRFSQSEN